MIHTIIDNRQMIINHPFLEKQSSLQSNSSNETNRGRFSSSSSKELNEALRKYYLRNRMHGFGTIPPSPDNNFPLKVQQVRSLDELADHGTEKETPKYPTVVHTIHHFQNSKQKKKKNRGRYPSIVRSAPINRVNKKNEVINQIRKSPNSQPTGERMTIFRNDNRSEMTQKNSNTFHRIKSAQIQLEHSSVLKRNDENTRRCQTSKCVRNKRATTTHRQRSHERHVTFGSQEVIPNSANHLSLSIYRCELNDMNKIDQYPVNKKIMEKKSEIDHTKNLNNDKMNNSIKSDGEYESMSYMLRSTVTREMPLSNKSSHSQRIHNSHVFEMKENCSNDSSKHNRRKDWMSKWMEASFVLKHLEKVQKMKFEEAQKKK
ncbi:hypothetical protein SNEBB_001365 [Seison nebaliae]|nr:hypothetical protein SNEBB_001365 [Seison nebaliae]